MTMRPGYWWLPDLADFQITSESTPQYNCFAWALGEDSLWMDPDPLFGHWPEDIPSDATVNSFIELFRSAGYELCDDGNLEAGCEKIAIYALNDSPTHAARQLENGQWTSKLGKYEDIVHSTPDELQGEFDYAYGRVAVFMVRPRSGS